MSKHVDLIAVGALLVVFAFASRVHDIVHIELGQARFFKVRPFNPVVVVPPCVPAAPRIPRFPRV
jgi:hypothetical protein